MKIAIVGYGIEGRASYQYWRERGDVTIVDERSQVDDIPDGVATILGEGALAQLEEFDLVVRSAGISPKRIKTNGKVWSATNEFFLRCPAPIIGVTGTKGKGTTSSFIASILESAGQTVHLVGNIGKASLSELPNINGGDIVVYELSSFQLWDIEKSPQVAVVLMIEPDHLDVHDDMQDYLSAKQGIARHQQPSDTIIYNASNSWSQQIAASSLAENRIAYPYDIGSLADSVKLPGRHNIDNAAAAIAAARQFMNDDESIAEGLASFKGLEHRLKLVGTIMGVNYYDDSIATTPGSAIAAISAFEQPKIIILGGSDKGADYTDIIKLCQRTHTKVIAMGQTGRTIESLCSQFTVDCSYAGGMHEAVMLAQQSARPGDVVILSPASASFDQYKNYADRGDKFISAVNQLATS